MQQNQKTKNVSKSLLFKNINPHPSQQSPLVSIVIAFFNEESILKENLETITDYLNKNRENFDSELILIDDGSSDQSNQIAQTFVEKNNTIHLYHHPKNLGLGKALQLGFSHTHGNYVIVLDADLSYCPEHIPQLLAKLIETGASVITASPYMDGGKTTNIPWLRRILSKYANRFLAFTSNTPLTTLTGMVRGYNGKFIRGLSLRGKASNINAEIIYKSMILGANIEEIPAHLKWLNVDTQKRSKMNIWRHTLSTLFMGFLLKPLLFFIVPGLIIFIFAIYTNTWMFIHFFNVYFSLQDSSIISRLTVAFQMAYDLHTHTFIFGLLSTMLAVQLISTGLHSLQTKRYFEELFVLGTKILRQKNTKE